MSIAGTPEEVYVDAVEVWDYDDFIEEFGDVFGEFPVEDTDYSELEPDYEFDENDDRDYEGE